MEQGDYTTSEMSASTTPSSEMRLAIQEAEKSLLELRAEQGRKRLEIEQLHKGDVTPPFDPQSPQPKWSPRCPASPRMPTFQEICKQVEELERGISRNHRYQNEATEALKDFSWTQQRLAEEVIALKKQVSRVEQQICVRLPDSLVELAKAVKILRQSSVFDLENKKEYLSEVSSCSLKGVGSLQTDANFSIDAPPLNHPMIGRVDDTDAVPESEEANFKEGYDTVSDNEVEKAPQHFLRPRGLGLCVEVHGPLNPRRPFVPKVMEKSACHRRQLFAALQKCRLFANLEDHDLGVLVDAMSIVYVNPGKQLTKQSAIGNHGEYTSVLFVVLAGALDCYREGRQRQSRHEACIMPRSSIGTSAVPRRQGTLVMTLSQGRLLGEMSILWNGAPCFSLYAHDGGVTILGVLEREVFQSLQVQKEINSRTCQLALIRGLTLFETLDDEQIAKIIDCLTVRVYRKDDVIFRKGEDSWESYVVVSGECLATAKEGHVSREIRRLQAGDIFGEHSLLSDDPRSETVVALDRVEVLCLSRSKFERLLGPLTKVKQSHYLCDPRKVIADFFSSGDGRGPQGALPAGSAFNSNMRQMTSWFAVYRPTNRDAIAKMCQEMGVGKGLNIKGRSAKLGVISGYVPFLQISDNTHKEQVQSSPGDSRVQLYFKSEDARTSAWRVLRTVRNLVVDDSQVYSLDDYIPGVYGIDIAEMLFREVYFKRPDISPVVGWESGRPSSPAYQEMNFNSLRMNDESCGACNPKVVLLQHDSTDPMNPHGLLMAYAETDVKPVVSDFDTFTVGSKEMQYEALSEDQVELAHWTLDRLAEILNKKSDSGWTVDWLEILNREKQHGFDAEMPPYGYGDPSSCRLVEAIVKKMAGRCGVVRHGSECFNFTFPQELDKEYLVVWNKFLDPPWRYVSEQGLRDFLLARAQEGFAFPLNPVWPVRDPGWYEVLHCLRESSAAQGPLASWFPTHSGLLEKIDMLHKQHPQGLVRHQTQNATGVEEDMLDPVPSQWLFSFANSSKNAAKQVDELRRDSDQNEKPPDSPWFSPREENVQRTRLARGNPREGKPQDTTQSWAPGSKHLKEALEVGAGSAKLQNMTRENRSTPNVLVAGAVRPSTNNSTTGVSSLRLASKERYAMVSNSNTKVASNNAGQSSLSITRQPKPNPLMSTSSVSMQQASNRSAMDTRRLQGPSSALHNKEASSKLDSKTRDRFAHFERH